MSERLIDDVAAWLAAGAELTVGETLYKSDLPENAELAAVIKDTGGPARSYGPHIVKTYQVTVRGAGDAFAAVHDLAQKLYDVIYPPPDRLPARNVQLSDDWLALTIDAIQPPADLGVGESGRRSFVFNMQIKAGQTGQGD